MNELLGRLQAARQPAARAGRGRQPRTAHPLRGPARRAGTGRPARAEPGRARGRGRASAEEVTRLARITDELLLLARGDEDKIPAPLAQTDIGELLTRSADRSQPGPRGRCLMPGERTRRPGRRRQPRPHPGSGGQPRQQRIPVRARRNTHRAVGHPKRPGSADRGPRPRPRVPARFPAARLRAFRPPGRPGRARSEGGAASGWPSSAPSRAPTAAGPARPTSPAAGPSPACSFPVRCISPPACPVPAPQQLMNGGQGQGRTVGLPPWGAPEASPRGAGRRLIASSLPRG